MSSEKEIDLSPITFEDDQPIEIPVVIKGIKFTLREATGDAACKYRNAVLRATELTEKPGDGGKMVRLGNMADVEPLLVSLCLFDADNKPVSLKRIRSWPPRIITALYDRAKQISELDQEEDIDVLIQQRNQLNDQIAKLQREDPAKNEQSETLFGSE